MIRIHELTKVYGKKDNQFTALDSISFEIKEGATAAIIGKSGSGKSTLMHVMSGLDRPSKGSVQLGNADLFLLSKKAMDRFRSQSMSFIFQSFYVEANQTCYQNVSLPLEIAKVPLVKRKKMITDALRAVELSDKASNLAANLSGGQKQRLAIARAIVNNPSILFADEPTGNLDSATGELIMKLLFKLNKERGCSLIIVTHDVDLAARCQTQIEMKDGKIQRINTKKPAKKTNTRSK